MSFTERRASERRPTATVATIRAADSSLIASCEVCNLSEGGAKLLIDEQVELPEEFMLFLRTNSTIGRRCRTIWRIGRKVGVRFASTMGDSPRQKGSGIWAAE